MTRFEPKRSVDQVLSVLLAAARLNVEQTAVAGIDDIDPIGLVEASGSHGVDHLLLDAMKIWAPNHPAVALLQTRNRQTARFHLRALVALRSATAALHSAGVNSVAFKGPILATLSLSASCRAYSDLDLMVEPGKLEVALEVLEHAGAFLSPTGQWKQLYETAQAQVPMRLPLGVPLDLHWHLCSQPHMRRSFTVDDAESLIDRSISLETATGPANALDWSDMLVHTAGHAGWSGADRLGWLVDVDSVVRRSPVDWDTVINRTRAWGLEAHVGDVLRRTADLLHTPIPPEVPEALRGGAVGALLRSAERLGPMAGFRNTRSARRILRLDVRSGLPRTVGAMTHRAAAASVRRARQRSLDPLDRVEPRRPDDQTWRRPYLSFATSGSAPRLRRRPVAD